MDRTAVAFAPLTGLLDADPSRHAAGIGDGPLARGDLRRRHGHRRLGRGRPRLRAAHVRHQRRRPPCSTSTCPTSRATRAAPRTRRRSTSRTTRRSRGSRSASSSPTARAAMQARAIGVRLRGSRGRPAATVAYDGVGWGGPSIENAGDRPQRQGRRRRHGRGGRRRGAVGGPQGRQAEPGAGDRRQRVPGAAGRRGGRDLRPRGRLRSARPTARCTASFYDDKSSSRADPGPEPRRAAEQPGAGPGRSEARASTRAGDRTGDFAFAWVQGAGGARSLVVAQLRPPAGRVPDLDLVEELAQRGQEPAGVGDGAGAVGPADLHGARSTASRCCRRRRPRRRRRWAR